MNCSQILSFLYSYIIVPMVIDKQTLQMKIENYEANNEEHSARYEFTMLQLCSVFTYLYHMHLNSMCTSLVQYFCWLKAVVCACYCPIQSIFRHISFLSSFNLGHVNYISKIVYQSEHLNKCKKCKIQNRNIWMLRCLKIFKKLII